MLETFAHLGDVFAAAGQEPRAAHVGQGLRNGIAIMNKHTVGVIVMRVLNSQIVDALHSGGGSYG